LTKKAQKKKLRKKKSAESKDFRPLPRARRLPQPPPLKLLKKLDQNLRQPDEARLFCLQFVPNLPREVGQLYDLKRTGQKILFFPFAGNSVAA